MGSIMRCTLCTVHNHLQVRQIHRNCPNCMIDIFLSCVLAVLDPSNAGACRKFHTILLFLIRASIYPPEHPAACSHCRQRILMPLNSIGLRVQKSQHRLLPYISWSDKRSPESESRPHKPHLLPTLQIPAISAFASISPDILVSQPTIIVGLCLFSRVRTYAACLPQLHR